MTDPSSISVAARVPVDRAVDIVAAFSDPPSPFFRLPYEEIFGHLLLLLYMAKSAAETILSTHFPLIWSHKLQNITFILVFFHPRLQHENFLTLTRKYNSL